MIDLEAKLVFDFFFNVIGVGDAEVVIDESLFGKEVFVVDDEFLGAFVNAAYLIPVHPWGGLEGGGKGEVGGAPDAIGDVARGDGEVGEGDLRLFTEAK